MGSGTSHGVPVIGCDCPVCKSKDPRDNRYRASAFVTDGEHNIVIDTGPEFRIQALRQGIKSLDAVLMTHGQTPSRGDKKVSELPTPPDRTATG